MNQLIIFYIQGSEKNGLGHVKRSINLAIKLKEFGYKIIFSGEFSRQALNILKKEEISSSLQSFDKEIIVIDAISIKPEFLNDVKAFKYRILISPIFEDYGLPSHILSRSSVKKNIKSSCANQEIIYNPGFSFSTVTNFRLKKSFRSENIKIGICISGSSSYFNLDFLLEECTKNKNVSSVIAIASEEDQIKFKDKKIILQQNNEQELWKVLDDIDLLISGDGLMIFEAMSLGIPAISLYRTGSWDKNSYFYEQDFCVALPVTNLCSGSISDILYDRKRLEKIRANLKEANFISKKDLLFKSLLNKIEDIRSEK
tara:strand:+ start:6688 stop:7629 length:942 start_codon:yes stop_codon:yes gene_type:complete